MLTAQILNGIVVGAIYGLFALGFTLIFGINHFMNMAHGAVFMWGAFGGLFAALYLGASFFGALLAGGVVGAAISILLYWTAFRLLRRHEGAEFSAIVSSIGANQILVSVAQQASQTSVMRFPADVFPTVMVQVAGIRVQLLQLIIVATAVVIFGGLLAFLYRTKYGRQARAVAFSEQTAKLLGISPSFINVLVFGISGALAGIAGVLIGLAFNAVDFTMGQSLLMLAFVIIIVGGLGSIVGTLIASFLVGMVHTLSVAYLPSGVADAIVFAVLFAILLVRPAGLFGGYGAVSRVARR
jgi:branched-chain amino acid transport system permease protein